MATITAYQSLLLEFTPRAIRNDREYQRAMRHIERLMHKDRLSRAESELLDLLATLAEQYEAVECPLPKASQRQLLEHLMEARGATQSEVAAGARLPRSMMSNVLAGRRNLSQTNIMRLAQYFHVSPAVFLESAPG